MAQRPVFLPQLAGQPFVSSSNVDFKWVPGLATSQKQKCIRSFHSAASEALGIARLLEISSKSESEIGRSCSAFRLNVKLSDGHRVPLDVSFNSGKDLEHGGP